MTTWNSRLKTECREKSSEKNMNTVISRPKRLLWCVKPGQVNSEACQWRVAVKVKQIARTKLVRQESTLRETFKIWSHNLGFCRRQIPSSINKRWWAPHQARICCQSSIKNMRVPCKAPTVFCLQSDKKSCNKACKSSNLTMQLSKTTIQVCSRPSIKHPSTRGPIVWLTTKRSQYHNCRSRIGMNCWRRFTCTRKTSAAQRVQSTRKIRLSLRVGLQSFDSVKISQLILHFY